MVKYPNFGSTSGLYGTLRAPTIIGNEEPCVIQSEKLKTVLWAGPKYVYASGAALSGFYYYSGESDIEPPNASGWGQIRVPELSTVHTAIVVPRCMPFRATPGYPASGVGGYSGNVFLVQWEDLSNTTQTSGISGLGTSLSGLIYWNSGLLVSGLVDVWAIGGRA